MVVEFGRLQESGLHFSDDRLVHHTIYGTYPAWQRRVARTPARMLRPAVYVHPHFLGLHSNVMRCFGSTTLFSTTIKL
jgi:hypothetical protein